MKRILLSLGGNNNMSLQFILGRAGTGKSYTCLEEIRSKLLEDPTGSPIVYLVPDQMTFQSEYDLISTPGIGGMMRAQVFSFTRLAWRVLQETGGMSRYHVNNVGVNMLLRKIIDSKKQDLKVFSRAADKNGFITQMEEMVAEFKRYCVTPEILEEQKQTIAPENKVLSDKLHDLQLLYDELEKHLFEKYVDSEDYLRLLAEKIPQSSYITEAEILIDGFHSFTPQELEVLGKLMKVSKKVTIALTVDKAYDVPPHDLSLFRMTGKTYQSIIQYAKENEIKVGEPVLLTNQHRYSSEPSLAHLERYFDERPTVPYQAATSVTLSQAVNRRAEIEGIAREIQKLARDKNYRYRDIAIMIRNASEYHEIIETIFQDYHIPFFIDQKRSMLNHPLIELIRSSLEVVSSNWRYESVFRCVKTDLLYPFGEEISALREDMDKLENYVLEYGIQGFKWTNGERWKYKRIRGLEDSALPQTDKEREYEDMLNDLRTMVVEPLLTLGKRLQKAKDGRSMCEALFLYLEDLEIPAKMEELKLNSELAGKLSEAREHDQVWNAVLELFDQYVEIIGDEKVSLSMFSNMIETGLESMQFALVPPAIDQVLVASLERSRFSNIKCTFIIGANDGVIPARPNEEGVFSESDRDTLGDAGLQLAPGSRETLLDENFLIYCALTSPQEMLYISYPLANEEGKSLLPSPIIKRLKDIFPKLEEKFYMNEPSELPANEQLEYIVNPDIALSSLATQLQAWKKQYPIQDLWWDVYNYFANHDEIKYKSKLVLSSLFYKNKPKNYQKK